MSRRTITSKAARGKAKWRTAVNDATVRWIGGERSEVRYLGDLEDGQMEILARWYERMVKCGDEARLYLCPKDGHTSVYVDCCKVPVCAWNEARHAAKWGQRARLLMQLLPGSQWRKGRRTNTVRYRDVRSTVKRYSKGLPPRWKEPRPSDLVSWRMSTVNLRDTGDLAADLDRALGWVRRRFARFLARKGQACAFIVLDVGNENDYHVHLHALSYGPNIDAKVYERWHRSLDCTVPGCPHEPGDTETCNGSFEGDLRFAWSPSEALKYACEPPDPEDELQVELRLAVYVLTFKRHRIEPYGLAKAGAVPDIDQVVHAVVEGHCCPHCGAAMVHAQTGSWQLGEYQWSKVRRE